MSEASFLKYWPRSLGESSDHAGNAAFAAATAALVSLSLASWTVDKSNCDQWNMVEVSDGYTFSYNLVS